ncbi:hypothetical protein [Pseudooceanicola sp. LIPI14-2-Ac024]|uniref:hypothetical protein n=1 Tax=Pseudooceanicola sp. LIPI14-2-Ac024 TaxID=3344875 RepID=UPI0035CE9132
MTELDMDVQHIVSEIAAADPVTRHMHLDKVHDVVSRYALTGKGIPRQLRQLQEDLTNEAIEARFDNMPV